MAKLALIIIGMIAVCFFWSEEVRQRKSEHSVWWNNEQIRVELAQKLKLKRYKLDRVAPSFRLASTPADWNQVRSHLSELKATAQELEAKRDVLSSEVTELNEEFDVFRISLLRQIRASRIGERSKEFLCKSGNTLFDAEVVDIQDAGVSLRHRDGFSRLRFGDLTVSQQIHFGVERESAAKAIELEQKHQEAYAVNLKRHLARVREKERVASEIREAEESRRQLVNLSSSHSSPPASALATSSSMKSEPADASEFVSRLSQPPRKLISVEESAALERRRRARPTRYFFYCRPNYGYRWNPVRVYPSRPSRIYTY